MTNLTCKGQRYFHILPIFWTNLLKIIFLHITFVPPGGQHIERNKNSEDSTIKKSIFCPILTENGFKKASFPHPYAWYKILQIKMKGAHQSRRIPSQRLHFWCAYLSWMGTYMDRTYPQFRGSEGILHRKVEAIYVNLAKK